MSITEKNHSYHLLLILVLLPFVVHLAFYYNLPLNPDEAYYWTMSQELALSYYHHTGMVAWLLAPLNWLAQWYGGIDALSIRLYTTLFFVVSGLVLYYLLAKILDNDIGPAYNMTQQQKKKALLIFAYSLLLSPMALLAGSIWTHDTPLILFLSLSLLTFYNAYRLGLPNKDNFTKYLLFWALCGLMFGMSILSKYTTVLWGGAAFFYMLFSRQGRQHFMHCGPWIAALVVIICFLPIVIWNIAHDWVSLGFRFDHLTSDAKKPFEWRPNLDLTLGAIVLTLGLSLLFTMGRGLIKERSKATPHISWLLWQTLFPVAFFLIASAVNEVYFNWMIFSLFLCLMLFAIYAAIHSSQKSTKPTIPAKSTKEWGLKGHYAWQVFVSGILFVLVYADYNPVMTKRFFSYAEFGRELSTLQTAHPDAYLFGTSYQTHAVVSWTKKELQPYTFIDGHNNNYDYLSGKIPPNTDVLLFSYDPMEDSFAKYFDELIPLKAIELSHLGKSRTVIYSFLGTNNKFKQ